MAHFSLLLTLLFSLVIGNNPEIENKLNTYVHALEESETFTGVIMVRFEDQLFAYAMGYTNTENSSKNSIESWFRYASISKPFTAVLLYRMEQEGLLKMEDLLTTYYDDRPNWEHITLAHLLAHRSGIPNYTSFDDFVPTMHLPTTNEAIIERFKHLDLEFEPGSAFSYSNSGYTLLSDIIERVSGLNYAEALKHFVLKPGGIEQAAYEDPDKNFPLLSRGYTSPLQVEPAMTIHMSIPQGAGGVAGDARALLQLLDAVYNDDFLSETSRNRMFKPVSANYGHGWALGPLLDYPAVGHAGGINGFATNFMHVPIKELSIVVLSNTQTATVGTITRDLAAVILGRSYTLPEKRTRISVAPEILIRYEGVYELFPGFTLTITTEDDRIFAQATNQPQFEIFPSSETEFYLTVVEARIVFTVNENEDVTGLTLFQGGQTIPGKKME